MINNYLLDLSAKDDFRSLILRTKAVPLSGGAAEDTSVSLGRQNGVNRL